MEFHTLTVKCSHGWNWTKFELCFMGIDTQTRMYSLFTLSIVPKGIRFQVLGITFEVITGTER